MGLLTAASYVKESLDGWMETAESLDPTKALRPSGGFHMPKLGLGGKPKEVIIDEGPSARFEEVQVDIRHRPDATVGTVDIEVLGAGGWTTVGVGDALSAEDTYALLVLDGGVARTNTKDNAKAPAWGSSERRAFRFRVADPSATLYCAVFDEDSEPLSEDDPIGRCAVALRALAPGTRYDAWFPLTWKATESEALANDGRALVAGEPLATAATAKSGKGTQTDSRGAVRLRISVAWDDGGATVARSALMDVLQPRGPRYVVAPATKSGKKLRETVRFAMYGEGACDRDNVNEPFSTARVTDHVHELVDLLASAAAGLKGRIVALVTYRDPPRSLVAFVAWMTSVSNSARAVAWFWVLVALDLFASLRGDPPVSGDLVPARQPPVPLVARPQLTSTGWAGALAGLGVAPQKATTKAEDKAAQKYAAGEAENILVEQLLEEWRAKRPVEEAPVEDDDDVDPDDYASKKPMKSFSSLHPLAGFLRPVQRALLGILRPLRAIRGLASGTDDPVATATVAGVALVIAAGAFFYSELMHGYVVWALSWFFTILLYLLGVALFGPQNYFLVKAYAKKRRARHIQRAQAGFDPEGFAALKIQDFYRLHQKRLLQLAAEAKARAAAEDAAKKREEADAKRLEAEAKKQADVAAARKAAIDDHDVKAMQALKTRQRDLDRGPLAATKNLDSVKASLFSSPHVKHLRLEDDDRTFTYADPKSHAAKHIHLKNVTHVSVIDPTAPKLLKFRTGHKEYTFHLDSEDDCVLLVNGLKAASSRLQSTKRKITEKVLRIKVPEKPFGILNASVVERQPARMEAFRSHVLPAAKPPKRAA